MTVGTNSSSSVLRMIAALNNADRARTVSMTRLATGNRINRASDDPAGVVALNALNAELAAVNAAIESNSRTEAMLNVADSTLTEVSKLISDIEGLVLKATGSTVTAQEKAAYQAQIDESLDSIDRIINQATFNGQKLFDGTNRIAAFASNNAAIKDIKVYSRNPNITGNQALTVTVNSIATRASSTMNVAMATPLSAPTVIQITGKLGTANITLNSGANSSQIIAAIVAQKQVTGVSATVQGANLNLMSTTTGSDSFVSITTISGDSDWLTNAQVTKVTGTDAKVTVNGSKADAQGTQVFYNGGGLSLSFNLANNTVGTYTLTVGGGGATFQLGTNANSRTSLGIGGVNTFELGRSDLGYLSQLRSGGAHSLTASNSNALAIAREAATQVATASARLGSFIKYQIAASNNSLEARKEAVSLAASQIGETDYTLETANLQKQEILIQTATAMLSLANAQQQNVLRLLQ
ncbi:MAG TPA: flagellin [Phycisphaerae bacterium]|nr:flagellin [Phycisphaerae bacterium]HOM53358.1 flagellin [Phycisphaerae bacterium]HON66674.1 flagellin [Phycisphaerae bacterium]HPP28484.1 flagellin [Phycisphaerae bacterium]HPU26386.1 flagellin [Phycisphaerae bacterium]